jgi:hypothetical protein
MNQHLLEEERQVNEMNFSITQWYDLTDRISLIFNINEEKVIKMRSNKVMHLVAALPFIAGCRNPQRIALSHISIYMLASVEGGRDTFQHNFTDNDSLFTRLERISHFDGGEPLILERGMNMIAYAMLGDHNHDKNDDAEIGKYNPLNTGVWNFEKITKKLKKEIKEMECPQLDKIMNIDMGPLSYWSAP